MIISFWQAKRPLLRGAEAMSARKGSKDAKDNTDGWDP
jgi:hypothetical protein